MENLWGSLNGYQVFGGRPGYERGKSIIADSMGNLYVVGEFSDTVDFDSSESVDNKTSNGDLDLI